MFNIVFLELFASKIKSSEFPYNFITTGMKLSLSAEYIFAE